MATKKTNIGNMAKSNPNGKTKVIAGTVSIAIIAGNAGYVHNEIISPPGSIYTVTYYRLRKV